MPAHTVSLSNLDAFGKKLAESFLQKGSIIGLKGTLGSGKTTLVRHILESAKYPCAMVTSPTFSYLHVYEPPEKSLPRIYHFDLYRLATKNLFIELGFLEYLEEEQAVCFIEWPEKVAPIIPRKWLLMHLEIIDTKQRRFSWTEKNT